MTRCADDFDAIRKAMVDRGLDGDNGAELRAQQQRASSIDRELVDEYPVNIDPGSPEGDMSVHDLVDPLAKKCPVKKKMSRRKITGSMLYAIRNMSTENLRSAHKANKGAGHRHVVDAIEEELEDRGEPLTAFNRLPPYKYDWGDKWAGMNPDKLREISEQIKRDMEEAMIYGSSPPSRLCAQNSRQEAPASTATEIMMRMREAEAQLRANAPPIYPFQDKIIEAMKLKPPEMFIPRYGGRSRPTCDQCYEDEEHCECEEFDGWTADEIADRRMDYEKENDLNFLEGKTWGLTHEE